MIDVRDIPETALINMRPRDYEAIKSGEIGVVYKVLEGDDYLSYLLKGGTGLDSAAAQVEKHKQLYFVCAESRLHEVVAH